MVPTNFCVPLGPRAAGGGPSGTQKLINKNLFEAKTSRKPCENLAKTSRKHLLCTPLGMYSVRYVLGLTLTYVVDIEFSGETGIGQRD